jgi:hypothetical protein
MQHHLVASKICRRKENLAVAGTYNGIKPSREDPTYGDHAFHIVSNTSSAQICPMDKTAFEEILRRRRGAVVWEG